MIIDNILTVLGIIFGVYILLRTRRTLKDLRRSQKNVEEIFLYGSKNVERLRLSTKSNKVEPSVLS